MKKLLLSIGCMLLGVVTFAQTEFRKQTFEEALAMAKEEGKMVFVDYYTTWGEPCKMMMTERVRLGRMHGVFRVCLGYTVDARLRHVCAKAARLSGCETTVMRKWSKDIHGPHH